MTREAKAVSAFLAAIRRTTAERKLLKGGEHVVLAVSGGPDSLALLHAFARLAPEYDLRLHVAHFDHRLRPDSGDDALFVRRQAERLSIPITVGVADDTAPLPKRSPEESARSRRLSFLSDTARAISATRIATGHTLDDQAETVLMRALVGAGRRGLSGIPPTRWYYIRPLIDVSRADVESFCRALRLRPRLDPTNADPAFLRNLLRAEIIPLLRERVNARLPESLARLADVVRDEDQWLDAEASRRAGVEAADDGSRLSIDALREMPAALQRRAIRLLARNEGPGIDHAHTERVRRLALAAETGKELHLPGPLSARVEYGFLVLGRAPSFAVPPSPVDLAVPGETDVLPWSFAVRTWITDERPVSYPDARAVAVLDADRCTLPLRVRPWRAGDRFRPLGAPGEKKVGDFFTDAKVAKAERAGVPLIVDAAGVICWVVGYRTDERVKVTRRTRRHLWVSVEGGTA